MRELKLYLHTILATYLGRTFTGAWIETNPACIASKRCEGRTFTGAWIETKSALKDIIKLIVAPLRVRELKPIKPYKNQQNTLVAPLRVRELKHLKISLPQL